MEINDNESRIVEYSYNDGSGLCEGTTLVRCEKGQERKYLESKLNRCSKLEIKKIYKSK